MSTPPRVSVIIPTYKRAHVLPRAIDSILAQTAADQCEIIVIDDGSPDDTPAVAERYAGRIVYHRQENAGLAGARNAALSLVTGTHIAFCDDDDAWLPDKVARQLAAFEKWPEVLLVAGAATDVYADGATRPHRMPALPTSRAPVPTDQPVDLAPLLFHSNCLCMPTVMVRRDVVDAVGPFATGIRGVEDYHMWTRIAARGPAVLLSAPLALYTADTPGAFSRNIDSMLSMQRRARRLLRVELRRRPDCRAAWRAGLGLCVTKLRDHAYRAGRYTDAARWAVEALWHNPRRPRWEWARTAAALGRAIWWGNRAARAV